jgi:trehalose synthase
MLRSLVSYALGQGFDARWVVIGGSRPFFAVTKELHNQLHGHARGRLGEDARAIYDSTLASHAKALAAAVRPGDVVVLHDPQTAGLVAPLRETGAIVIWRSHIGTDRPTEVTRQAWAFLLPYIGSADGLVFSSERLVPHELHGRQLNIIAPSIDPAGTKNSFMAATTAEAILRHTGLVQAGRASRTPPGFGRGRRAFRVMRLTQVVRHGPGPRLGVDPLVLHLARWDRLKDPIGVMRGFTRHVLSELDAYLVIAGPPPGSVADDPEAEEVFEEVVRAWRALPTSERSRVQLAVLPNDDPDENAAIVNALQRASDVVVKKSLEEGFGLGATEAMWKGRPVVASRVGGLQEQIADGCSGVLLDDPTDLGTFGAAVSELLVDEGAARRLGVAARRRVGERFLHDRHLAEWLELLGTAVMNEVKCTRARCRRLLDSKPDR